METNASRRNGAKSSGNSSSEPANKILAAEKRAALEGVKKGGRAAVAAFVATAIPTVLGARMMAGRARFYFNYAAQASIISASTMAAFYVVSDKATLACARANSMKRIQAERAARSD